MLQRAEAARLNHGYLENQLFSTAIQRGKDSIWRRGVPNSGAGGHYLARASEGHSGPHKRGHAMEDVAVSKSTEPEPTVYSYHNIPNTPQPIAEGTRMARMTAQLDDAALVLPADDASPIPLDTPAWFAWLEHATTFVFTARKEWQARGGDHCCT